MHRKSRENMQEVMGQDQTTASRPQPKANASSRHKTNPPFAILGSIILHYGVNITITIIQWTHNHVFRH